MVAERLSGQPGDESARDEHGDQRLLPTARDIGRAARRGRIARGAGRRACLVLLLGGVLAACGKKGALELPPEEPPPAERAPAGQPPAEPLEDEGGVVRDEG